MKLYARGPSWEVYQGDARDLLTEIRPSDHVITDPPYLGPPAVGSGTHARKKRTEHDAVDPALIRALVERAASAIIITGSTSSTMTILDDLPTARRILPIIRPGGQVGRNDPWTNGNLLAHVFGFRDRAGADVRLGFFDLPRTLDPRRHIAELPISLGAWLAVGIPPDARVVDPFAGSGALLLGARRLGLAVVAGDVDAAYCRRIADRLEAEPSSLFPETGS